MLCWTQDSRPRFHQTEVTECSSLTLLYGMVADIFPLEDQISQV